MGFFVATDDRRESRLAFAPDEKLFRTFSRDQIRGGRVKYTALRLQISVWRGSHCTLTGVSAPDDYPQFNGVASIDVLEARNAGREAITTAVVDEPTTKNQAHSLIALVTNASPGTPLKTAADEVRNTIASKMVVVRLPA